MTDTQIALILSAITGLGGSLVLALRWAVNRVTKSNDDGTAALIANTASNAVLVVKQDQLVQLITQLVHSNSQLGDKISEVSDFVEEHTPVRVPKKRARTDPMGHHQWHRPKKDDE